MLVVRVEMVAALVVGGALVAVLVMGVHWWLSADVMDTILICFPKLGK